MREDERELGDGSTLRIARRPYLALQNDGPFAGTVAVFVQLCSGNEGKETTITEIAEMVALFDKEKCVLFSQGDNDPFLQNFVPLTKLLNYEYAVYTVVETCGEYWIEGAEYCDIICAPKSSKVDEFVDQYALAFKYTIDCRGAHVKFTKLTDIVDQFALPSINPYTELYLIPFEGPNEEDNLANRRAVARLVYQSETFIVKAGCNLRSVLGIDEELENELEEEFIKNSDGVGRL